MVLSLWTNQYRVGSLRLRMKKAPPLIQSGPIAGLGTVGQPDDQLPSQFAIRTATNV